MGVYSPQELNSFVKATWKGTNGDSKLCQTLSAISIMECGPKIKVRDRTGHLGGHRCTIKAGARDSHLKAKFVYHNLKKFTPYERTLSLSRHFTILYHHYGDDIEKTCKVWNQGNHYQNQKAQRYWHGVLSFEKIYLSGEIE